MTDPTRWKYSPTRGELKFWLILSLTGLCLMVIVLVKRGIPTGPALFEVVALPSAFLGYLLIRSVKRLIRREHP
jgi:hypothetical protein